MVFDFLEGFEYDELKSQINLQKHGISFHEAQRLWGDPERVVLRARFSSEPRWLLIARLNDLVWAAIFTERQARIRIISVRRARHQEKVLYEGN
ncbi:MAG: BrnT family toxin [Halieaceae bacterium]|nr:BrnT family toxin [Halieaceae bacterium]